LYFTNLSFNTNEQELMSFLKEYGFQPQKAKLLYHESGKSKGTGFVQMDSDSEA
jgi:RNA recognition motif-containing protein